MSIISAKVTKIQENQGVYLLELLCSNYNLSMMSLSLNKNIKVNTIVNLNIQAVNVAIAKDTCKDISYSNQVKCTITSCEYCEILCSFELSFNDIIIESVITAKSAKRLDLKKNDKVVALIKASHISIQSISDD